MMDYLTPFLSSLAVVAFASESWRIWKRLTLRLRSQSDLRVKGTNVSANCTVSTSAYQCLEFQSCQWFSVLVGFNVGTNVNTAQLVVGARDWLALACSACLRLTPRRSPRLSETQPPYGACFLGISMDATFNSTSTAKNVLMYIFLISLMYIWRAFVMQSLSAQKVFEFFQRTKQK